MKLNKVLLSTKQTAFEYFKREYDDLSEILDKDDLTAVRIAHKDHYRSLNHIIHVLGEKEIEYDRVYMPYAAFEEFKERDLVITVGGDGTVLNTARYIRDDTPVLTVRSNPQSFGALCEADAEEFEQILEKIINNKHSIEEWTRIEGKIGPKPVKTDLALNDIIVGPRYRSGVARYEVTFRGVTEQHIGSGMLITTGAGSTGWYESACGETNGMFSHTKKELRFIATECHTQPGLQLLSGKVEEGEILEIRSLMNINAVISFDGDNRKRMHDFRRGKTIQVTISDKPLKICSFSNSKKRK